MNNHRNVQSYYEGDICITGIAGKYPQCNNIDEFKTKLMDGVDMVTEDNTRWPPGMWGLPRRAGKILNLDRFDNTYFGVLPKLAHKMDPMLRIMLEQTYEAIVDSGYNPDDLRGKQIMCVCAPSGPDALEAQCKDPDQIEGSGFSGATTCMLSHQIAYGFDFKGTSLCADSGCASSLTCLEEAVLNIRMGNAEAAVVANCTVNYKAQNALTQRRYKMISDTCRVFDAKADGFVKSECISVLFIQKQCDARRNYATIVDVKSNGDGWKEEGISCPSSSQQAELLKTLYSRCRVCPNDVSYIEAHGTGTPVGDPMEMKSITEVFCQNRKQPLLVGSVKSNMGHAEVCAGVASIGKVVIAFETGMIPGNLHYETPNPKIPSLFDGSVKVVNKNTPWNGGYIGVSSFGAGGVNAHVLLQSNPKPKLAKQVSKLCHPRLFQWCGRTEHAVQKMLNYMNDNPNEVELFHLLSQSSLHTSKPMPYRGYTLIDATTPSTAVQKSNGEKRPIWYIFTGMGCQWPGMAKDLMNIKPFAESIERSHNILSDQFDIDLKHITTCHNEEIFSDLVNVFVGYVSVQIALVDTLKYLSIEADGLIGHSTGELGCAYADGCLTQEQTIIAAYYRGKCSRDATLPPGLMATIGLSWEEAKNQCPDGVFPACNIGKELVTISGHKVPVAEFLNQLKKKGIFTKNVWTHNIGFHSLLINDAADNLLKAYKQIIPQPKIRTNRWVSTSIPEEHWNSNLANTSSAEYHVNNFKGQVLLYEALQHVPSNAIVIEIAPHCLLERILKQALPKCMNITITQKFSLRNDEFFLSAVGRLYCASGNPQILNLYKDEVAYPVGRGVPMISPLIEWDHSQTWNVPKYTDFLNNCQNGAKVINVDISSEDSKDYHLIGHKIDGRTLYPATGYLVLVWKTLAEIKGVEHLTLPVKFENVKFTKATILKTTESITLTVSIIEQTGNFVITEAKSIIVTGNVFESSEPLQFADIVKERVTNENKDDDFFLNSVEFYKELKLRGYQYSLGFKGVLRANTTGTIGFVAWPSDFIEFMDSLMQVAILGQPRALYLPTFIRAIRIDPQKHLNQATELSGNCFPVYHDPMLNVVTSGGIEIFEMLAIETTRKKWAHSLTLEENLFVPYSYTRTDAKMKSELLDYKYYVWKQIIHHNDNLKCNLKTLSNGISFSKTDKRQSEQYSNANSLHTGLLQCLESYVWNNSLSQNDIDSQNEVLLQQDSLLNAIWDNASLCPLINTVIRNTPNFNIKIVQLGDSNQVAFKQTLKTFDQHYTTKQLNIFATNCDNLDNNSPANDQHKCSIEKWNFAQYAAPATLTNAHFIFAAYVWNKQEEDCLTQSLINLTDALEEGGFLLIAAHTENGAISDVVQFLLNKSNTTYYSVKSTEFENSLKLAGLKVVSKITDEIATTIWLCRKITSIPLHFTVVNIDNNFDYVEELKNAIEINNDRVYLIANHYSSGIMGLVNCLILEPNGDKIRYIFDTSKEDVVTNLQEEYPDIIANDLIDNIYNTATNQWGAYSHIPFNMDQEKALKSCYNHAHLKILTYGNLASLRWIESPFNHSNQKSEDLIDIYYSALNFKDIMLATGKLTGQKNTNLGVEFSGINHAHQRIMGLGIHSLATTIQNNNVMLWWHVPDGWSLKQASTVSCAYATAYYALCILGNMSYGKSILIHSGAGGVGQAAIAISLSFGCTVYTTVGSLEKRAYLKAKFPQLTDDNFASSSDTSFQQHILLHTNGQGVNFVLNSLSGEKLQASLGCLSATGCFLEMGKYDMIENSAIGMRFLLKGINIQSVMLDTAIETKGSDIYASDLKQLHQLVADGIVSGVVQPLDATVFQRDDVENAFRFIASGKHIGKVVIQIREEVVDKTKFCNMIPFNAIAMVHCQPHASYIITGGLGGFGLELAEYLINRGARNIVLTNRSGITNNYQKLCLKRWASKGIKIVISNEEVKTLDSAQELIKESVKYGPVGGIFLLGMVLEDKLFQNQNKESFQKVSHPKADAISNLDLASRQLCQGLRWFVAFSSVSCGYGNVGQSNYGYANSVMERVCEQRIQDGFPALAIQWGIIGDVGYLENNTVFTTNNLIPQNIASCMEVLDKFLVQSDKTIVTCYITTRISDKINDEKKMELTDIVANILGISNTADINPDLTLNELGIDSLMTVEIRQILERNYEQSLSTVEVRQLKMKTIQEIGKNTNINSVKTPDSTVENIDLPCQMENVPKTTSNGLESAKMNGFLKTYKKPKFVDCQLRYDITQLVPKQVVVKLNSVQVGQPVFFIHPIEGNCTVFASVAKQINNPMYGMNCTTEVPFQSIESAAEYYLKVIKQIQPCGPFNIVGYSFGVSIAFEISLQLQRQEDNAANKLIMLDGLPEFRKCLPIFHHVDAVSDKTISESTQLENSAICIIASLFNCPAATKLLPELYNLTDLDERLSLAVNMIMHEQSLQTTQHDIEQEARLCLSRLLAGMIYETKDKLNGDITLIRIKKSRFDDHLGYDYNLTDVCKGKVHIKLVEGDHDDFLHGEKAALTANYIQQALDE